MFPIIPANSATESFPENDEGIFGYGSSGSYTAVTNLVSNTGVVSSDVTGVGTARSVPAACEYGGDKGIFGYGSTGGASGYKSLTNLVSNTGVVSSGVTGVGTARSALAACRYGEDTGIFGFGSFQWPNGEFSGTNLISNTGVVSSDVTGVGTARNNLEATQYGGDKGIFGYGYTENPSNTALNMTNLVSNTGVVSSDVTGVGELRRTLGACSYGGDKGIFGFGCGWGGSVWDNVESMTNLVSNTGVVSSDVAGVGTARKQLTACEFGGDQGIFGFGNVRSSAPNEFVATTNLVSNTGVVATDTAGVGTVRGYAKACSFN